MISTGLRKSWFEVARRVWAYAFTGEAPDNIVPLPMCFGNGDAIYGLTTANSPTTIQAGASGMVGMIGINASDQVNAPNGLVIPIGKTLSILGSLSNAGTVPIALITADGAIAPGTAAQYMITKAGVAVLTLAAPTSDGTVINVQSTTANAHTITATGLFQCGTAAVNLATFAAQAGAGLSLVSYNGKWVVRSATAITFS